jgi:hypothetical protein
MHRVRTTAAALGIAAAIVCGAVLLVGPDIWGSKSTTHATPLLIAATASLWAVMVATEAWQKRVVAVFTPLFAGLALAGAVLILAPQAPDAFRGERVRGWSTYHYYVGSKYFKELGYFDLYGATLRADDLFTIEGGSDKVGWADADRARNMRTYKLRPRAEIVRTFDASLISPARLRELGGDSRYFRNRERRSERRKLVQDLGYNPAPPWLLLGAPLANAIEPGGTGFAVITASDLVMHGVLFFALWWGFGLRAACIGLLWMLAVPLNRNRLVGGFFNYDWLAASAVAVAAWKKDRPALSAVALSWAAMTRVFPGLMALPIVIRAAYGLMRGERNPKRLRFAVVFCAACALLLVASHGTGRGLSTWPEWAEKISIHSDHHASTGSKRVGLGRLVLQHPRPGKFLRVPRNPTPEQTATAHARKQVVTLVGLGLLLVALRRRDDGDAMLLMLFAAWLATTSSRYYASVWLLLLMLPTVGPKALAGRWAGAILMVIMAAHYVPKSLTGQYLMLNYEALLLFVGLCGAYLWIDARLRQRATPAMLAPGSDGQMDSVVHSPNTARRTS